MSTHTQHTRRDAYASTTTPLQRRHYAMLDSEEVQIVRVHRNQSGSRLARQLAESAPQITLYGGMMIVMLALIFAIVVMGR